MVSRVNSPAYAVLDVCFFHFYIIICDIVFSLKSSWLVCRGWPAVCSAQSPDAPGPLTGLIAAFVPVVGWLATPGAFTAAVG